MREISNHFVKLVVSYGKEYRNRYLSNEYPDPELLLNDAWEAFKFFLGRACFQGRLDAVSVRVYKAIVEELEIALSHGLTVDAYKALRADSWLTTTSALANRIGKGKVGKPRDIEMVQSALEFIDRVPDLNLVRYSVERIRAGGLREHYRELQPELTKHGIVQVGPKIAAFYLRDVVALYSLDAHVSVTDVLYLQPVDTWVRKLAMNIGLVGEGVPDTQIQQAIVSLCQKHDVSPVLFNQGAWYIGYHSFDIVLELLARQQ